MTIPPGLERAHAALRDHRPGEAAALCREILARTPDSGPALALLAAALLALDQPQAALDCAVAARRSALDDVDLLTLHGRILVKLERYEEAAALHEAALARAPERCDVMTDLGVALFELDRFGPALALFRQAFARAPRDARVVANLGNFLDFAGSLDLALAAYEAAGSLSPGDREIRCNHGMALLRAGRWAEGWPLFECRRRQRDPVESIGIARLPNRLEDADIAGKRILVFHEQGFGDSVQFLRYVPLLAARGAEVLLRMPTPLARLAGSVGGVGQVLTDDQVPPALDFYSPMMSLPLSFGTTLEAIPQAVPYLRPPEASRRRWQAALAVLRRPRIGLVWAGSPRGGLDRRRSMSFATLAPLFDLPASFVSLQLGEAAEQWVVPPGVSALDPHGDLVDFAETAALIEALDLVITVDTAVAHVAGAIGKPVWVMSRFSSCWRWLMARDDSPWYPSLRLFRQGRPGDWPELVNRLGAALRHFCASSRHPF
jgi:tetratricopeptide (TPR) repeat protein